MIDGSTTIVMIIIIIIQTYTIVYTKINDLQEENDGYGNNGDPSNLLHCWTLLNRVVMYAMEG
jgi:hypothetical protein